MLKKSILLTLMVLITSTAFSQTRLGDVRINNNNSTSTYTLTINTNVRGAKISINDREITTQRVTLRGGTYTLQVEANGYRTYTERVQLNRNLTINATLEPLRAEVRRFNLTIDANVANATILIDNRAISGTRVTLTEGQHTLTVRAPNYNDYNSTVTLSRDMVVRVNLERAFNNYTLTVRSNINNSQVYINGDLISGNRSTLREGVYNLTVKANGFIDYSTTVDLNKDLVINTNLEPIIPTYRLKVKANVGNTNIVVDGNSISGNQVVLDAGNHTITVTANGYIDYTTAINLNKDMDLNIELQRISATINVSIPDIYLSKSNNGALSQIKIYDNGKKVNNFNFEVEPGEHVIKIESGSFVLEGKYDFVSGKTYEIKPVMYLNIE